MSGDAPPQAGAVHEPNKKKLKKGLTSALRQIAFGLTGWQLMTCLVLEHVQSLGLPHVGVNRPGSRALFVGLSPELQPTLEVL
ncbi:hypothetical protein ACFX2I_023036 [Malus domestica]